MRQNDGCVSVIVFPPGVGAGAPGALDNVYTMSTEPQRRLRRVGARLAGAARRPWERLHQLRMRGLPPRARRPGVGRARRAPVSWSWRRVGCGSPRRARDAHAAWAAAAPGSAAAIAADAAYTQFQSAQPPPAQGLPRLADRPGRHPQRPHRPRLRRPGDQPLARRARRPRAGSSTGWCPRCRGSPGTPAASTMPSPGSRVGNASGSRRRPATRTTPSGCSSTRTCCWRPDGPAPTRTR